MFISKYKRINLDILYRLIIQDPCAVAVVQGFKLNRPNPVEVPRTKCTGSIFTPPPPLPVLHGLFTFEVFPTRLNYWTVVEWYRSLLYKLCLFFSWLTFWTINRFKYLPTKRQLINPPLFVCVSHRPRADVSSCINDVQVIVCNFCGKNIRSFFFYKQKTPDGDSNLLSDIRSTTNRAKTGSRGYGLWPIPVEYFLSNKRCDIEGISPPYYGCIGKKKKTPVITS